MIHRFLSMNSDWVEILSELQPYTEQLQPKQLYLAHIGILPKGRHYLRYVKGKKTNKFEGWLIELMSKIFNVLRDNLKSIVKYFTQQEKEGNQ